MAKVTCKICKGKIEKEQAFCIEKVSEKTGKVSRSYYCSREEYEKDKFLKSLWRELLLLYDDILGYTCISKTKVNMIKELENLREYKNFEIISYRKKVKHAKN